MGHNKGVRRADIMTLFAAYGVPMRLNWGELDQCADLGKYEVYLSIFPEHHHLFRKTGVTFNHNDALPDNYFGLAGRYYKVVAGAEVPVRYITPQVIPQLSRNNRIKAKTAQPAFFLSDNKIKFIPNTMATVVIEYFELPTPLADPDVVDATTDSMPEFSEPDIARSGFEFAIKLQLDRAEALKLTQEEIDRSQKGLIQLYEDAFQATYKELGSND